jgi:hypothetical protein
VVALPPAYSWRAAPCGLCRADDVHSAVSQLTYGHSTINSFAQVVVDAIDPSVLVSRAETKLYDFGAIEEEELHDITIPLDLQISAWLHLEPKPQTHPRCYICDGDARVSN